MATRTGRARWNGDLKAGSGRLTVGEGAWEGDYSFRSRFEDGAGTNPEELIAAAHAACFSMALSNMLAEHGHEPQSVETVAHVELRPVDGAPTITRIELETEGDVPSIDEDHFREHAEEAKAGCPVSRALAGVDEITLTARLV
jgi:osmotically inducible protein OsmC